MADLQSQRCSLPENEKAPTSPGEADPSVGSRKGPRAWCPVPRRAAVGLRQQGGVLTFFKDNAQRHLLVFSMSTTTNATQTGCRIWLVLNYTTGVGCSSQELPVAILNVTIFEGETDRGGCGTHPFSHLFSTIFKSSSLGMQSD